MKGYRNLSDSEGARIRESKKYFLIYELKNSIRIIGICFDGMVDSKELLIYVGIIV
jgi:hypothetical protein